MVKLKKLIMIIVLTGLFSAVSFADEGMWMPHQMKDLNLEKQGLKMNPADLYNTEGTGLMSAVVYLGGGTGEFVSSNGLILTNHHVAFGAIQRASTSEHDYIMNGFYAESQEKEIPAIGYIADVLLGYEDITDMVHSKIDKNLPPLEQSKAMEALIKEIVADAENKGPDLRCVFKSMYSGNQYYLFTFKRLKDVRMVYAPPRAIGNFGGDIDNWMWPRHTGDFTFLRAYVSKDNIGADYSEDNVPYQPKRFLKLSLDGLEDGDFTFVMGYPGRTYRNMTVAELKYDMANLKTKVTDYRKILDFIGTVTQENRDIEIKYASLDKGLNNSMKNYTGKLDGLKSADIMGLKKKVEQSLLEKAEDKTLSKTLKAIEQHIKDNEEFSRKAGNTSMLVNRYFGSAMLSQAHLIYKWTVERQKPDMEREPGYQERDSSRILNSVKFKEKSYEYSTDRKLFAFFLNMLSQKPEGQWPDRVKDILKGGKSAVQSFVSGLYQSTVLNDVNTRLELLNRTPDELLAMDDPFIKLAADIEKDIQSMKDKADIIKQERKNLKKDYLKALLKVTGGRIAPDANASIRFTSGHVAGYSPRDGIDYLPFTTLKGVMEKETGKDPFIVPEKLNKLYYERDFGQYKDKALDDVVTCFLNTTNVTGGNSGSPVLNGKGEQVGIVFDMTYESVIGDYYIIPELQRTIHVDIRYVLFVTEKYGNAMRIIKELGL